MSQKSDELKAAVEKYIGKVDAKIAELKASVDDLRGQLANVTTDADLQPVLDTVTAADALLDS